MPTISQQKAAMNETPIPRTPSVAAIAPMNRSTYAAWGFGLMLFKYVVETIVVLLGGGASYSLIAFLTPVISMRAESISGAQDWVVFFITAWSLPFVFVALRLTMDRAIDAGISPWTCLWILCPLVNLVLMIAMCFVGSDNEPPGLMHGKTPSARSRRKAKEQRDAGMWLSTILSGLVITTLLMVFSVYCLGDYGATIFFSAPVLLGVMCGYSQKKHMVTTGAGPSVMISLGAVLLGSGILVALALEGIVCIVMALPIMMPAAAIGGWIGYLIACSRSEGPTWTTVVLMLPSDALVEHAITQPMMYEVVSSVEIDATPAEVWPTVVAFPPIEHSPGWLFQLGVAYPVKARIDGHGDEAVRYCEFSTGDFVESIRVWDKPNRLAFDVESQPCPLTELSPYANIHPPHLNGFLRSHRGEFQLIALPGGRTRLQGHTWYSVDMYPQSYWKLWTDSIIHAIHHRVLDHIADVVEAQRTKTLASAQ